MEFAPVAGIRAVNLLVPWRVDTRAQAFAVDASVRADDEERQSNGGADKRGLDEDVSQELEPEEAEHPREWIDVTV